MTAATAAVQRANFRIASSFLLFPLGTRDRSRATGRLGLNDQRAPAFRERGRIDGNRSSQIVHEAPMGRSRRIHIEPAGSPTAQGRERAAGMFSSSATFSVKM